MNRHYLAVLLLSTVLLFLTACGSSQAPYEPSNSSAVSSSAGSNVQTPATPPEVNDTSSGVSSSTDAPTVGNNVLVVWFSRVGITPFDDSVDAVSSASVNIRDGELVGNMQYLAEFIGAETDGDLFQIITEKEYPTDYRDTTDLAAEEQENGERPALTSHVENMEQYDVIFLGYPNWWGTLPQAVVTFLEEYDFSGKTIIPYCSHGGSRLGSGPRDIAALCPNATLLDGLAVSGSSVSSAQKDVQDWLAGL